jgi:hypothetical protein
MHAIKGVAEMCRARGVRREDVQIVFAEQRGSGAGAQDFAKPLISALGFPTPEFRAMHDSPPLQAADMVAWYVNSKVRDVSAGRTWLPRERHAPLTEKMILSRLGQADVALIAREYAAFHFPGSATNDADTTK